MERDAGRKSGGIWGWHEENNRFGSLIHVTKEDLYVFPKEFSLHCFRFKHWLCGHKKNGRLSQDVDEDLSRDGRWMRLLRWWRMDTTGCQELDAAGNRARLEQRAPE